MLEKVYKNRILNTLALIVIFFFTERSIKRAFIFRCTYRMQTITSLMLIFCSILIIGFFAYTLVKKQKCEYKVLLLYFAIYFCALISTIINGGSYKRIFDSFIYSIPPLMLTSICFANEKWKKAYLRIGLYVFVVLATLNFAFIKNYGLFFVISEWCDEYFLGYHTEIGFPLMLGMFFAMMCWQMLDDRVGPIIYFVLFFLNIYLSKAGTTKIVAIIILIYLILPPIRTIFKKWNFVVFGIIVIAFFAVLTICIEKVTNTEFVKEVLLSKLNRDTTLTGRTIIWRGIYPYILDRPLFGHGVKETAAFYLDNEFNHGYVHAHNLFMQTLYEIGTVGLAVAGYMVAFTTKRFDDKSKISADIKFMVFIFLFAMQCDIDSYYPWYLIAFVCNFGMCYLATKNQVINLDGKEK